ncbi:MAG: type II CRISPR RNA-guided endonuclease Cas9 [Saprospiraceae bacterium]
MKKILGLDIGTNSIGWALVTESESEHEKAELLKTGVRIISADAEHAGHIRDFEAGKAITLNAGRSQKRGMRRNNHRYKLRRKRLLQKLVEWDMLPGECLYDKTALQAALQTNDFLYLYSLRNKAAKGEQLTWQEVGRVLYHLNQKRGYKSNRKANAKKQETGKDDGAVTTVSMPQKKGFLSKLPTGNKYWWRMGGQ